MHTLFIVTEVLIELGTIISDATLLCDFCQYTKECLSFCATEKRNIFLPNTTWISQHRLDGHY